MTISVCMAIYNGEKYIEKQLQTILEQNRPADEVILCDDGSTDETVDIVKRFIQENKLDETWKLYQNTENRGYPGNFYYAMSLCTGDIVFLADQDDIWHREKIQKVLRVMERHRDAKVVCCKFGLIDSEGNDIHALMAPAQTKGTEQLRNVTIAEVFYKYEWPGMVMAYRNEWYRAWMAWKNEGIQCAEDSSFKIPHDLLISAKAAEENGFLQLDEELAYHRRHDNNAGGEEHRISKLLNKQRKLKEIEEYLRNLRAFAEGAVLQTEEGKAALQRKLQSMQGRYEALQSGKISSVLKNARKNRAEVRLATVLCDVMIAREK